MAMEETAMMTEQENRLNFASDYLEGAHPAILQRLQETNFLKSPGYGTDDFSESAREKIREACQAPGAEIFFLAGGTQTNVTVIDALLRPWQGVLAAETGHISVHEAGAIEAGGHKVLTLEQQEGKITADTVHQYAEKWMNDENHDHMVAPGMVYISQPTESGTLYLLQELEALSSVCREEGLLLYADGARLAYSLACPINDVMLPDLARLCDVFYIGGTKCGALFGEAVVFPKAGTALHFFTIVKQHGALLAKGRIAGIQFDTLFTEELYQTIGQNAIQAADRIRKALIKKGYKFAFDTPTNQIFIVLDQQQMKRLSCQVEMSFWEKPDEEHTIMRIATSWATSREDVDRLIACL